MANKNNQKELELSFVDQQPHFRVYGRYFIIFPFPDVAYADVAVRALRVGLSEVLRRFPYFAGSVDIPDPSNRRLRVLYNDPVDVEAEAARILTTSLDAAMTPSYDYNSLAEAHFPPERFVSKVFCPGLLKDHPRLDDGDRFAEKPTSLQNGKSLPAFAAQATFIPGGLVLSVWFYHAVADASGNAHIQEVWSAAVRALTVENNQGPAAALLTESTTCQDGHSSDSSDSQSVHTHSVKQNGLPDDREGLADMVQAQMVNGHAAEDPSSARRALALPARESKPEPNKAAASARPLRKDAYKVVTKLIRIPASRIAELTNTLRESTHYGVSRFAALASLLWAHVLRVRAPLLASSGNTKSTLAVVVDLRKHLDSPFNSPDYLGNLVLSTTPSISIPPIPSTSPPATEEVTLQHIVPMAREISKSIHAADTHWATSRLATVLPSKSSSANGIPTKTEVSHLTFPNGPDLYITSWQHMGADREWCLPGTGSVTPTAMRRAAWVSEGGIVVLPRRNGDVGSDAVYEVMISLAEEDMWGLKEEMRRGGWVVDGCEDGVVMQTTRLSSET